MTDQGSLLDVLADIDPDPSPTVDLQRGYRPRYERCPDCNGMAYAMVYAGRTQSWKVLGVGWLTTSSCACGRYVWRSLQANALGWNVHLALELPLHLLRGVDR